MNTKKVLSFVMALSLLATPVLGNVSYAVDEPVDFVLTADDSVAGYSEAQQAAFDKITASCTSFVDSSVSLSTDAFSIIQLDNALTKDSIATIVADIKKSYPVLTKVGVYSSDGDSSYKQIVLFTQEKYRTAEGREDLKVKFEITQQPVDATVEVGETATFTVGATGDGLSYQWQVSSDAGKTWRNSGSTGNKTATFIIYNASTQWNGYMYRCIVTGSSGKTETSAEVKLTVESEQLITTQPVNTAVEVGGKAVLTVATSDSLLNHYDVFSGGNPNCRVIIAFPNTVLYEDNLKINSKLKKFNFPLRLKQLSDADKFQLYVSVENGVVY